mmetsp:Transcript_26025/g.54021  ORF Transcript_26025/g.54021 Transcript_26025/m.54021 type:complete len:84 (+) Transcript_26025:2019-2270(+)
MLGVVLAWEALVLVTGCSVAVLGRPETAFALFAEKALAMAGWHLHHTKQLHHRSTGCSSALTAHTSFLLGPDPRTYCKSHSNP